MRKTIGILVRLMWLTICVAALADAHKSYQGSSDWKLEEELAFHMIVLSFPASLVVVAALILVGIGLGLFGLALPASSRAEMTATWFLFVAAGYIHWFVILPMLLRHGRREQGPKQ